MYHNTLYIDVIHFIFLLRITLGPQEKNKNKGTSFVKTYSNVRTRSH